MHYKIKLAYTATGGILGKLICCWKGEPGVVFSQALLLDGQMFPGKASPLLANLAGPQMAFGGPCSCDRGSWRAYVSQAVSVTPVLRCGKEPH